MIKIKDDVDLRELEKFGFDYHDNGIYHFAYHDDLDIKITEDDRELEPIRYFDEDNNDFSKYSDLLYNLTKADLVEKV